MKPYGEMLTLPLEFASITGAWIETALAMTFAATVSSRPSRARGLKQEIRESIISDFVRVHHGRVD
ncbi:hypothetical protein [Psychrobacter sp. LFX-11D]|uniref:hypothetical protein n=1 Tax=Psychrobacter sp. LFX-11D TaxID=458201 RepID=UPI0039B73B7C